MHSAAVRQLNTPAGRRHHASDIQEHRNRPAIAARAIQIPNFDASAGVICSTITSRVTCHSANPTPPVWLRPVRAPAKILRGYLKSSVQRVWAYAMIKKAFDENGIKFAFPTVQVASEGEPSTAAVAQRGLELTHPAAAAAQ